MKALTIRQPWASLICYGIKDVENRSWKTNFRGKLLIHSSSFKCKEDFPYALMLEHGNAVLNDVTFGNIDLKNFPSSAIIGYVDLSDCVEDYDSIWASAGNYQFVLKNAHFFDEPIMGVKGKLNLFDYELDENNLPPSHKVELRYPKIENDEIIIPVNDKEYEDALKFQGVIDYSFYHTGEIINLFTELHTEDNLMHLKNFDNIKTVSLQAKDGRKKTFKFLGADYFEEKDEETGEVTKLPSVFGDEREVFIFVVSFE